MIRIRSIHIKHFRGIRDLDLELAGQSFGICGPNGTGKSGVVDAIEFCLTGDVTRLSGQGSGALSVKKHAPHVDQREHSEKANVTITADFLGKKVRIRRCVKDPKKVEVSPKDAAVTNMVAELGTHPEFALSRREIVKYIITRPGQRATDVQTLLRLDHIERLRKAFTGFRNRCRQVSEEAERNRHQAETDFLAAFGLDRLDWKVALEAVNEKRQILGLSALAELKDDVSFRAGLPVSDAAKEQTVNKARALAELSALQTVPQEAEPATLVDIWRAARATLKELVDDKEALALARRYRLIRMGLDLVTEDACPLCDAPWKMDNLRDYLQSKILSAEKIKKLVDQLRANIDKVLEYTGIWIEAIRRAIEYSNRLEPQVAHSEMTVYLAHLKEVEAALKAFLEDPSRVKSELSALSDSWWHPTKAQEVEIGQCLAAISALPDTSAEDVARDVLSVAQDRYERLLHLTGVAREKREQSVVAERVLDHYNRTASAVLEGIYDRVAESFSTYYRAINVEDEDEFVGKLTPKAAQLSLDVDFYGRGLFPPGAYHSEGHQDAMGLCLYLALMKHTLGSKFTFAVLDDVLMSVDAGHRRSVCRLLKTEFPETQFILTTHDRVWLAYMRTEKLISRSQSFSGWTVDFGPRVLDNHDVWAEIQAELAEDNVARAAWLLRRYLEYIAAILADNLRAQVEFRGDARYDLGDLLPPVLKRWRTLLERGQKSAAKWNLDQAKEAIAATRERAKDLAVSAHVEQWPINAAVHFNEWANFQAREFQGVVDVFKDLLSHLRCDNPACQSYLYVSPRKGKAEELRCSCGMTSINLKTGKP